MINFIRVVLMLLIVYKFVWFKTNLFIVFFCTLGLLYFSQEAMKVFIDIKNKWNG